MNDKEYILTLSEKMVNPSYWRKRQEGKTDPSET